MPQADQNGHQLHVGLISIQETRDMPVTQVIHCPVDGCDYQVTVKVGENLGHQRAGYRMRLHDEHPDHPEKSVLIRRF